MRTPTTIGPRNPGIVAIMLVIPIKVPVTYKYRIYGLECLAPLSTIFQLYRGGRIYAPFQKQINFIFRDNVCIF